MVKLVTQPARAGGGAGGGGGGGPVDEGVVLTAGWVFWDEA